MENKFSQNLLSSIKGELFIDKDFDSKKYFYESFDKVSFNYKDKSQKLEMTREIIKQFNTNHENTSEELVQKLLENYGVFVNLGKYIMKMDNSLERLMLTEKRYSSTLQSLKTDIEKFNLDYQFEKENVKKISHKEKESKIYFKPIEENKGIYTDILTDENNESFDEIFNPKEGSARWLEELSGKLEIYAEEKNFKEGVQLILNNRAFNPNLSNYVTKNKIDKAYNFFLEKSTFAIANCIDEENLKKLLDILILLGDDNIFKDTLLEWFSNQLKIKYNQIILNEDSKFEFLTPDNKIKILFETFVNKSLTYLDIFNKFFNDTGQSNNSSKLDSSSVLKGQNFYSRQNYLKNWIKNESKYLSNIVEQYFCEITTIEELKLVIQIYEKNSKNEGLSGKSGDYILTDSFINNFKYALDSICINILKSKNVNRSDKELQEFYFINNQKSKDNNHTNDNNENNDTMNKFKFQSCNELGFIIQKTIEIILEFANNFDLPYEKENIDILKCIFDNKMNVNNFVFKKSILIKYLEEYFFNNILVNEINQILSTYVMNKVSLNSEVKTFSDSIGMLPGPNNILLIYSISLSGITQSLENLRNNYILKNTNKNPYYDIMTETHRNTILSLTNNLFNNLNSLKDTFFKNFLKSKIENHFFKGFSASKFIFMEDSQLVNKEINMKPELSFLTYYYLIKSLIINMHQKKTDPYVIKEIYESLLSVFIDIMYKLVNIENFFNSELKYKDVGLKGIEVLIFGIIFVKNSSTLIFSLNAFKDTLSSQTIFSLSNKVTESFNNVIKHLITEFCLNKKIKTDILNKDLSFLEDKSKEYIENDKSNLLK